MTLPNYVEYGPRETAPPPFSSPGGNFLGLLLKGDATAIEKLCDRVLNEPFETATRKGLGLPASPFTYKPFCEAVFLFAGRWEGLVSTPLLNRGSANEDEVSLWVPLKKFGPGGVEQGVCVMVPYLFVNNPMSVLNGREDYGFQKSYGELQPSPLPGKTSPPPASVAVKAFGGVFDAKNTAGWVPVLRVDPVAATRPQPAAAAADCTFPATVLGKILCEGVNQVFLKQFRDAKEAGKACFQQLVEAPVRFDQPHVKLLKPGEWRVEIQTPSNSSHPITEDLGLQTTVTPYAFELQSGLKLEPGKIIV
jgi:hypothetical protein